MNFFHRIFNNPVLLRVSIFLFVSLYIPFVFSSTWVFVVKDNKYSNFLDLESIKIKGNIVYFDRVANLEQNDKSGKLSSLIKMKANCMNKKIMYLSYKSFTKKMGEGTLIKSVKLTETKWIKPKPGLYKAKLVSFACDKANYLQ